MKNKITIKDKTFDTPFVNELGQKFYMGAYEINYNNNIFTYILLYKNLLKNLEEPLPVRINSACLSSDIFEGSSRCDCKWQLDFARNYINEKGAGMIIYAVNDSGRGHGMVVKLKSYKIIDKQKMTSKEAFEKLGYKADNRRYQAQSLILKDLGITDVEMLTNNPKKVQYLKRNGINVTKTIPVVLKNDKQRREYLLSKERDFGHKISKYL
ncbi:MAG: GTP cyclohydrolase [Candidatus Moranbacteria bacterium]|nr:GTP cyclohydrolase [Candidatus Moranbacteria bacterium]